MGLVVVVTVVPGVVVMPDVNVGVRVVVMVMVMVMEVPDVVVVVGW